MINILIVGVSNEVGGIEKIIYEIYKNIDTKRYHFDFIAFSGGVAYQDYYESKGSKVFSITKRSKNPIKHFIELKKFIKYSKYDYVWINTSSAASIAIYKYIKRYTSSRIITHSHGTTFEKNGGIIDKINYITDKFNRPKMIKMTDLFFACSMLAGLSLFGETKRNEIIVVHNGIDINKYKFNESIRKNYRIENKIDGLTIGFIGRLTIVKSPIRMIKIFEQILKYNSNSFLLIAGDGPLMNDISKVINDSSFSNKIRLLGNINNVSDVMNSCDVVVMPSLHEGLPLVAIEAQCNGLPVVFSNTISEEAVLSNNCARIGLGESDDSWAKLILEMKAVNRSDAFNIVNDKGYNIEKVTKQLENIII